MCSYLYILYMSKNYIHSVAYILVSYFLNEKCIYKTVLKSKMIENDTVGVVVALLFYVHGKHLRSCRDGQLT